MKKLLAIALLSLTALVGCGKPATQVVVVQQNPFDSYQSNPSREAYCRSIGLYKEWDSNECETWADAYDLDESGVKKYKKKYKSKYDKKYSHVIVIKDPAKLKAAKAKEKARLAELKKQQAANKAKKDKLKKQKQQKQQKPLNFSKSSSSSSKSSSSSSKSSYKSSSSSSKSSSSKRR